MEAGDALYIPGMWWHHVEALDAFNVLVNYWWQTVAGLAWTRRSNALMHALLSLRDLPPAQRAAWRGIFDHYVFAADDTAAAHIPERGRGVLGPHGRGSRAQPARAVCSSS